jgi:hypothetical protein
MWIALKPRSEFTIARLDVIWREYFRGSKSVSVPLGKLYWRFSFVSLIKQ